MVRVRDLLHADVALDSDSDIHTAVALRPGIAANVSEPLLAMTGILDHPGVGDDHKGQRR